MGQTTKPELTTTTVTLIPARGEAARQRERARRGAKAKAAIKEIEKVRFLKRLKGEDCSAKVMTLAELEQKHIDLAKPKLISVWDLLIWTYFFQRADEAEWRGRHEGFTTGSSWAWAKQVRELGVIVQGGGQSDFIIAKDAQTVHAAVRSLPDEQAVTVIESAALAKPVAWQVVGHEARVEPVLRGNGKPKKIWDENRNAIGCKVVCSGLGLFERRDVNRQLRGNYQAWHGSLKLLYKALSTSDLKKHKLQGLGVTERPWLIKQQEKIYVA